MNVIEGEKGGGQKDGREREREGGREGGRGVGGWGGSVVTPLAMRRMRSVESVTYRMR